MISLAQTNGAQSRPSSPRRWKRMFSNRFSTMSPAFLFFSLGFRLSSLGFSLSYSDAHTLPPYLRLMVHSHKYPSDCQMFQPCLASPRVHDLRARLPVDRANWVPKSSKALS